MKIGARKVLKDKPHNKPHIQGMLCYKPLVSFIVVLIIVHLCSFFFVIFVMLSRDFVSVLVGLFGAFEHQWPYSILVCGGWLLNQIKCCCFSSQFSQLSRVGWCGLLRQCTLRTFNGVKKNVI